jgi:Haem-binding domain
MLTPPRSRRIAGRWLAGSSDAQGYQMDRAQRGRASGRDPAAAVWTRPHESARTQGAAWDAPETRELAVRACFDCHSNETVWPWYSHVAPISWLVWSDVVRGRKELNFSEWDRPQLEARESGSTVRKGLMPPWYYPWGEPQCHRAANADPRARRHRWPQVTGTGAGTKDVHHP